MDKSEENRLGLKFDFTSPKVTQKCLGGLLLPYLDTPYARSPKWLIRCFSSLHFCSPYDVFLPSRPSADSQSQGQARQPQSQAPLKTVNISLSIIRSNPYVMIPDWPHNNV